jgi:predicted nucleic acid-binding protein
MPLEPLNALLDGHVLDFLLVEGTEAIGTVLKACESGQVTLHSTHILADELNAMPLDKGERWAQLEALRARLTWAEPVPTAGFIVETSRLNEATLLPWSDVETLQELMGNDPRNAEDALLAMTALRDGLTLVTADKAATKRARAAGVVVLDPLAFVRACHERTT